MKTANILFTVVAILPLLIRANKKISIIDKTRMIVKEEVYKKCLDLVSDKVLLLKKTLVDLRESAANETKSTAGDKHETALAMLQIEQANTGRQLQEALSLKSKLEKTFIYVKSPQIICGSLIKTNNGNFFLSVALGRIKVNEQIVIVLSPQAPLGKKLIGLMKGDVAELNGLRYVIEEIE